MRHLIKLAIAVSSAVIAHSAIAEATRPNILFLFTDDQRFDTLGCAGHPIVKTPTIDRLAAKGVRFENAFVTTPVCWVSRAVVLTGQWARSHAIRESVPTVKPESLEFIFPVVLRQAGYRTAHFGKWHLKAPPGFKPEKQYDEFEDITWNPYFKTMPDGSKRHETDIIGDRAIAFIESQPKDKPFCMNLWFNAAHAEDKDRRPGIGQHPWPQSTDGMYDDIPIPRPRLDSMSIYDAHPQFLKKSINRSRFFWGYDTPGKFQTNVRAYYRMISGIDKAVARVLTALDKAGLSDNTIVVYSGDNGYYLGDRGFQGKWSHFEESLRVPMVIYDPRIPASGQGRVLKEMALNVDLAATFVDWAGLPKLAQYEGRSLAPFVRGEKVADWRNHFFCEHLDLAPTLTWEGIRGERYVYARYFDQKPPYEFLYDLKTDPDELSNLAQQSSAIAVLRDMRALCDKEMNARGGALLPLAERHSEKGGAKGPKARHADE